MGAPVLSVKPAYKRSLGLIPNSSHMRAHFSPEPAKSDDSSESADGVIDRHAQAYNI